LAARNLALALFVVALPITILAGHTISPGMSLLYYELVFLLSLRAWRFAQNNTLGLALVLFGAGKLHYNALFLIATQYWCAGDLVRREPP